MARCSGNTSLAPTDRKVLGNGRLISAWPARGGPVLHEGKIYCAASIWPFMGVFIYALDATTGRVVWENSGTGANYIPQPHNSPAFAGVAPQGYLAAGADKLLVTSRTVPACFDRKHRRVAVLPPVRDQLRQDGRRMRRLDLEGLVLQRQGGVSAFRRAGPGQRSPRTS